MNKIKYRFMYFIRLSLIFTSCPILWGFPPNNYSPVSLITAIKFRPMLKCRTGVKEHYCPQNNTAGRQYCTGTKLPGGRIVPV